MIKTGVIVILMALLFWKYAGFIEKEETSYKRKVIYTIGIIFLLIVCGMCIKK